MSFASQEQHTVTLDLPDLSVDLVVDRGIFSVGHVDPGTKALLRYAPPPPATGELLDLGCGYGPVAVAIALRSPGARVWAVDIDERAVALTAGNASRAGAANVVACVPDEVPEDVRFDAIYSNPPIHVGKTTLHGLMRLWLTRLASRAPARLVVKRNLGSDSLARWLAEEGYEVTRLRSKRGYRILEVVRG